MTETVSRRRRRKKCLLSVCLEERKKGEERHRKRETDPSLTFAGERKRKKYQQKRAELLNASSRRDETRGSLSRFQTLKVVAFSHTADRRLKVSAPLFPLPKYEGEKRKEISRTIGEGESGLSRGSFLRSFFHRAITTYQSQQERGPRSRPGSENQRARRNAVEEMKGERREEAF